jgi:hypothetical protein
MDRALVIRPSVWPPEMGSRLSIKLHRKRSSQFNFSKFNGVRIPTHAVDSNWIWDVLQWTSY